MSTPRTTPREATMHPPVAPSSSSSATSPVRRQGHARGGVFAAILALTAALTTALAGCSSGSTSNVGGGSAPGNGLNSTGPTSCLRDEPGCKCPHEGLVIACGKEVKDGCDMGGQICSGGTWSECETNPDDPALKTSTGLKLVTGIKPKGLTNPGVSCSNNACDPYCFHYPDTPADASGPDAGTSIVGCGDAAVLTVITNSNPDATAPPPGVLADAGIPDGEGKIYLVLAPSQTATREFTTPAAAIANADIYFLVQDTSSMGSAASTLATDLTNGTNGIIAGIKGALSGVNANFGVGRFEDYYQAPYVGAESPAAPPPSSGCDLSNSSNGLACINEYDLPFQHLLSMQSDTGGYSGQAVSWLTVDAYQNLPFNPALFAIARSGGDFPEASVSAIWQIATGNGLYAQGSPSSYSGPRNNPSNGLTWWQVPRGFWTGSPVNAAGMGTPSVPNDTGTYTVPLTDQYAGAATFRPCPTTGTITATSSGTTWPCFRSNSTPVVVLIGDAPAHNGPGGQYPYVQETYNTGVIPNIGSQPAINFAPALVGANPWPLTPAGGCPYSSVSPNLASGACTLNADPGGDNGLSFASAIELPGAGGVPSSPGHPSAPLPGVYYGIVPNSIRPYHGAAATSSTPSYSSSSVGNGTYPAVAGPSSGIVNINTTATLRPGYPQRSSLRDCAGTGGNDDAVECTPSLTTVVPGSPVCYENQILASTTTTPTSAAGNSTYTPAVSNVVQNQPTTSATFPSLDVAALPANVNDTVFVTASSETCTIPTTSGTTLPSSYSLASSGVSPITGNLPTSYGTNGWTTAPGATYGAWTAQSLHTGSNICITPDTSGTFSTCNDGTAVGSITLQPGEGITGLYIYVTGETEGSSVSVTGNIATSSGSISLTTGTANSSDNTAQASTPNTPSPLTVGGSGTGYYYAGSSGATINLSVTQSLTNSSGQMQFEVFYQTSLVTSTCNAVANVSPGMQYYASGTSPTAYCPTCSGNYAWGAPWGATAQTTTAVTYVSGNTCTGYNGCPAADPQIGTVAGTYNTCYPLCTTASNGFSPAGEGGPNHGTGGNTSSSTNNPGWIPATQSCGYNSCNKSGFGVGPLANICYPACSATACASVNGVAASGQSPANTCTYGCGGQYPNAGTGTLAGNCYADCELVDPLAGGTETKITAAATLPSATLSVTSTTGFTAGTAFYVVTSGGTVQSVTCTGKTATTFTGCTGGTGSLAVNSVVSTADNANGTDTFAVVGGVAVCEPTCARYNNTTGCPGACVANTAYPIYTQSGTNCYACETGQIPPLLFDPAKLQCDSCGTDTGGLHTTVTTAFTPSSTANFTMHVASTAGFTAASASSPQTVLVVTAGGPGGEATTTCAVTYTGIAGNTFTGCNASSSVAPCTVNAAIGNAVFVDTSVIDTKIDTYGSPAGYACDSCAGGVIPVTPGYNGNENFECPASSCSQSFSGVSYTLNGSVCQLNQVCGNAAGATNTRGTTGCPANSTSGTVNTVGYTTDTWSCAGAPGAGICTDTHVVDTQAPVTYSTLPSTCTQTGWTSTTIPSTECVTYAGYTNANGGTCGAPGAGATLSAPGQTAGNATCPVGTGGYVCTPPSTGGTATCSNPQAVTGGEGYFGNDLIYSFTIPAGAGIGGRYYYHFALLSQGPDGSGYLTGADPSVSPTSVAGLSTSPFLYIKTANGYVMNPTVDASYPYTILSGQSASDTPGTNAGPDGPVLDCNLSGNYQLQGSTTRTLGRDYVVSEIDGYLPSSPSLPTTYYLVIDNALTNLSSPATYQVPHEYQYWLQVGGFDDAPMNNTSPASYTQPSYAQMVSAMTNLQAQFVGVENSGLACLRSSTETPASGTYVAPTPNTAQYETLDFMQKLAFDVGSFDHTTQRPYVVSVGPNGGSCNPTPPSSITGQVASAAWCLANYPTTAPLFDTGTGACTKGCATDADCPMNTPNCIANDSACGGGNCCSTNCASGVAGLSCAVASAVGNLTGNLKQNVYLRPVSITQPNTYTAPGASCVSANTQNSPSVPASTCTAATGGTSCYGGSCTTECNTTACTNGGVCKPSDIANDWYIAPPGGPGGAGVLNQYCIPPSVFIQSVTAVSTQVSPNGSTYVCGVRPGTIPCAISSECPSNLPTCITDPPFANTCGINDTGPDTITPQPPYYQAGNGAQDNDGMFNLCSPGSQVNFLVTFQMPFQRSLQSQQYEFDLAIYAGAGQIGRTRVIIENPALAVASFYRFYDANVVCGSASGGGQHVVWGNFTYSAICPTDGNGDYSQVKFCASASQSAEAGFVEQPSTAVDGTTGCDPGEVLLGVATSSPTSNATDLGYSNTCPSSGAPGMGSSGNLGFNVGTVLAQLGVADDAGLASYPYLRIRMELDPSQPGDQVAPILYNWNLNIDCIPSE